MDKKILKDVIYYLSDKQGFVVFGYTGTHQR